MGGSRKVSKATALRAAVTLAAVGAGLAVPWLTGSCSRASAPEEMLGTARQAVVGVGVACSTNADCNTNAECWTLDTTAPTKVCHCKRGFVACPSGCVDIATSNSNCGYCGNTCGSSCVDGTCGGTAPTVPWSVNMGTVRILSVLSGSHASWAHEGAPAFSLNDGRMFGLVNYTDSTAPSDITAVYNYASSPSSAWGTTIFDLPSDRDAGVLYDGGADPGADPGAATSAHSGLEYLSTIGKIGSARCIGVATSKASDLGGWDGGTACVNKTTEGWDAPTMSYDIAGSSLWLAGDKPSASDAIYVYKNDVCSGAIGSTTCQTQFKTMVSGATGTHGHHLVAKQCNPGAFMATRDSFGNIQLWQFMNDGSIPTCSVATGELFQPNTNCDNGGDPSFDCGGGSDGDVCPCGSIGEGNCQSGGASCWRISEAPRIAIKATSDHCFVYVVWDASGSTPTGRRFHARAKRFDIPDTGVGSGSCPNGLDLFTADTQTFLTSVEVSQFNDNVGIFYYKDQTEFDDHCGTVYQGRVDINLDFSTAKIQQISTSSFPNMVPPLSNTMGDYVAQPSTALPGGQLFPVWAAPVTTTLTDGVVCLLDFYNLRVVGRTVDLH